MERSQKKGGRKPRAAARPAAGASKPSKPLKPSAAAKHSTKRTPAAPAAKAKLAEPSPKRKTEPVRERGKSVPASATAKTKAAPRRAVSKAEAPAARREPAPKKAAKKRAVPARKLTAPPKTELATPHAFEPELPPSPPLSEEEQIEAAKYLPRELPPRLFEEERFIFPQSYGVTRLRLLVKDPFWLFAHWDVAPTVWSGLKSELGERTAALSRLTLRVADAQQGGGPVILLPQGARSWYVRADDVPRSYRAELGLTLPSGGFRRLAVSNLVTTPRVGPSAQRAPRRQRWDASRRPRAATAEVEGRAHAPAPGPWTPEGWTAGRGPGGWSSPGAGPVSALPEKGGASDAFRR